MSVGAAARVALLSRVDFFAGRDDGRPARRRDGPGHHVTEAGRCRARTCSTRYGGRARRARGAARQACSSPAKSSRFPSLRRRRVGPPGPGTRRRGARRGRRGVDSLVTMRRTLTSREDATGSSAAPTRRGRAPGGPTPPSSRTTTPPGRRAGRRRRSRAAAHRAVGAVALNLLHRRRTSCRTRGPGLAARADERGRRPARQRGGGPRHERQAPCRPGGRLRAVRGLARTRLRKVYRAVGPDDAWRGAPGASPVGASAVPDAGGRAPSPASHLSPDRRRCTPPPVCRRRRRRPRTIVIEEGARGSGTPP